MQVLQGLIHKPMQFGWNFRLNSDELQRWKQEFKPAGLHLKRVQHRGAIAFTAIDPASYITVVLPLVSQIFIYINRFEMVDRAIGFVHGTVGAAFRKSIR